MQKSQRDLSNAIPCSGLPDRRSVSSRFSAGSAAKSQYQIAAASAWGLLRNAFQEFPALKYAGVDHDPASAFVAPDVSTDAFGVSSSCGVICQPRMLPKAERDYLSQESAFAEESWTMTGKRSLLSLHLESYGR